MVADGLYDAVPKPDVVLGQHVAPFPAGWFGIRPGVTMASADSLNITLHGRGGHGSRPETTIDPVLMAAATTVRLQGIVSRELAPPSDSAVVTGGQIHSGTKNNIIPETATLGLSVRTFSDAIRDKILASIERIAKGESTASGAPKDPEIHFEEHFPLTVNDRAATERVSAAFRAKFGETQIIDPGPVSGSEDVGAWQTLPELPPWSSGSWVVPSLPCSKSGQPRAAFPRTYRRIIRRTLRPSSSRRWRVERKR